MRAWEELINRLVVGTVRQPFDRLASDLPPGVEVVTPASQPEGADRLLALSGVLGQMQRCGRVPRGWTEDLPAPAKAESAPLISQKQMDRYQQIKTTQREWQREWLDYAAERGYRMPPSEIAGILDLARGDRSFRQQAAILVGEAGHWLATHDPRWKSALTEQHPEVLPSSVWDEGSFEARLQYLKQEREQTPEAARQRLEAGFKSFPAKEREGFLEVLLTHLSLADEDFLEKCLDDKGAGVRQTARRLLSRLPESAFAGRMRQRLARYFTIRKTGLLEAFTGNKAIHLEVEMPTLVTPEDHRDYAIEKNTDLAELHRRLMQIVSLTQPRDWMEVFNLTPDEFVFLVQQGKMKDAEFKDHYWLPAIWTLVANGFQDNPSLLYSFAGEPRVLKQIPWDTQMKLLGMAAVRKDIGVILGLLGSFPYDVPRISPELSQALIRTLVPRFRATQDTTHQGYGHHYILYALTRCLHASCYPLAIECLGSQSVDSLHEDYRQFFRQYQERYEIYQELSS